MLNEGSSLLTGAKGQTNPWLVIFPATAMFLLLISLNVVADKFGPTSTSRTSSCERPAPARRRGPRTSPSPPPVARSGPSRASRSPSTRARRSASSASPARARPCCRGPSWDCCPGVDHPDRVGPLRRHRDPQCAERRPAQAVEHAHRHGVPGPDDVAQPGAADRPPDHRAAQDPPQSLQGRGEGDRAVAAHAGGHPLPRRALRGLPVRAVGRHAPARDDRHRPGLRPRLLLLADEPTTGLDVTVQAQILDLLASSSTSATWP